MNDKENLSVLMEEVRETLGIGGETECGQGTSLYKTYKRIQGETDEKGVWCSRCGKELDPEIRKCDCAEPDNATNTPDFSGEDWRKSDNEVDWGAIKREAKAQPGQLMWEERKKILYQVGRYYDGDVETTTGRWLIKGHYRPVQPDEVHIVDGRVIVERHDDAA